MNEELTQSNSYLSFKLGNEAFAAHVSKVLNILEMTRITEVPKAPEYMKGVINLRGKILPVVDTRIKFEMTPTIETKNTCIVVMDVEIYDETISVGVLVDEVEAVLELDKAVIQPPPSIGSKYKSEFIYGVAKHNDEFIMLLDMDKILSADEILDVQEKTQEGEAQLEGKEQIK